MPYTISICPTLRLNDKFYTTDAAAGTATATSKYSALCIVKRASLETPIHTC